MKQNRQQINKTFRFRRFSRKAYAVFASLHRQVTIGRLHVQAADASLNKQSTLKIFKHSQYMTLESIKQRVLAGSDISLEEALWLAGLTDREATVHMPGGGLTIRLDESTGHVLMTGGAETVFEGEIQPPTP